MEKFLHQTKVVYLKSFTQHSRADKFIPLMMVPFLCGLLLWLTYFKSLEFLENFQTFYMPLSICGAVRSYMMMMVNEKKNRQKENQLIMGLDLSSYYSGWILSCLTWTWISASVYIIMIGSFVALNWHMFAPYQYAIFYTQYLFYSYAIVGQMLIISSVFFDGRKATDVYAIFFIIVTYLYYFLDSSNYQFREFALSAFPQNLIVYFWVQKISYGTININYVYTLVVFFIQGTLGILFYIYIDQIMPNEIGTHKSPFFIFNCFRGKKTIIEEIDSDLELHQQISLGSELLNVQEQNQVYEQNETAMIQISQLSKIYQGQSVVNRLNLNLYKNQIFSLLGHNGAGKSTTINMICGLIEKDGGNIKINGFEIDKNLSEIRKMIGYCSQKDIIYDDLSVYDHLYYYGRLKHINQLQLSAQIENILDICQLQQDKFQYGRYLSGGGKRKLCLAIALIGNSQVLLLDEPTTGLDPVSRQQIWNILRIIKQDKCIVLTTHYLDEAQELSDYVGIISQGKLINYGTVDQIKRQHSVGFNIAIECQDENHQQQILMEVSPTIKLISKNQIKFIQQNKILRINIPLENDTSIPQILEYLESIKNIIITFQMTTLEDAYIKIHYDDQSQQVQFQENFELIENLGGTPLHYNFTKQIKSLVLKRIRIAKQNKWQYFLYLIVWVLLLGTLFGFENIQSWVIIWLYFFIKFIFISQQTYYPIYEKQHKIKHSYLQHGATIITYWVSTLIFDFFVIIFEQIVFLILLLIASYFNDQEYNHKLYYYSIIVNSLFSFGLNCQSYFVTYFYETTSASNVQLPFFILIYQCLVIIVSTLLNKNALFIGLFTPIVSFFEGYNLIFFPKEFEDFVYSQLNSIISSLFYFSLIVYLERKNIQPKRPVHQGTDAISVNSIIQQINSRRILNNINFSVNQQTIFGLLGPNGAGKTTLFNVISRLTKPTAGYVTIKDEETQVGLVPSFSPLHEDLSLVEHLELYGLLKGMDQNKIKTFIQAYCQLMDLNRVSDKRVKVLSGGERRKVQLGIALIGGSNILLMDEPTSGVDPMFRQKFQQLMMKNCQQNKSCLLFTTHSMSEAQKICDVLGIILNGELKVVGTLNQLRQNYDNRIQISFKLKRLENVDQLRDLIISTIPATQQIQESRNNYYTILVDGSQIQVSQLFRFCQAKSVQNIIEDFEIQQTTLDQIFKYYIQQQQYFEQPQQIQEEQQRRSILAYCCCQV